MWSGFRGPRSQFAAQIPEAVVDQEPKAGGGKPSRNVDHRDSDSDGQHSDRHVVAAGRWGKRYRKIAILVFPVILILGGAYYASRPGDSDDAAAVGEGTPAEFSEVDTFVDAEMDAQRIPGLSLAIVRNDQVVHARGFGEADPSGRTVSVETPFIIGSLSKSFTALAIMQLVEGGELELDAPVQQYIPWFRVADDEASAEITVRHLLHHASGISTKTGRSYQGSGDTSDDALEAAVRELSAVALTQPVGETHQYSTINYSVLGLIVQIVSGQSYESYVEDNIFDPLRMDHSFTSEIDAEQQGLATGHRYWFGRPDAIDLPYNRGLLPAGYLISSAEDMAHYLIAQLNEGVYGDVEVLSPEGVAELHRAAVPTAQTDTSYGMGWFVGPVNGIPAVFHQGETFNFHTNIVLMPESDQGVVVLMNSENSLDLFVRGRMGMVAEGVASIVEGQDPPPPPSRTSLFLVYAVVFAALCVQVGGMIRSAIILRRRQPPAGRFGPKTRTGIALALNLAWGLLVLVLLPRQLGVPLLTLAQGLPDLAYMLLVSGVVAIGWSVVRTVWSYYAFRSADQPRVAEAGVATQPG